MTNAKEISPIVRKTILAVIAVAVAAVLFSLFARWNYKPETVAERKLTYMAKDYYENYYYDQVVRSSGKEKLSEYKENGLPMVSLRYLLIYNDEKHGDLAKYFHLDSYDCDEINTKVKITPHEPYGKSDYKIDLVVSCNNE